jgi:hypothetical protein
MPDVHAKFGASSMSRWTACPGSIKHLDNNPMPSSDSADEGTLAHEKSQGKLEIALHGSTEIDTTCSAEMETATNLYVDYCLKLVDTLDPVTCSWGIEEKFQIAEDTFGTNDFMCYEDFGVLHIVDLKYGVRHEVFAEENKQLMFYSLGAVYERGLDVNRIVVHVVQPRIENPIKTWEFDYARLMDFKEELFTAKGEVEMNPDLRVPGDHCLWCNKAQCPEYMDKMYKETTVTVTDTIEFGETKEMTVDQLAQVIQNEDLVTGFLKDARKVYQKMAEKGLIDPADHGMKLVEARGNTAFIDKDKVPFRKLGIPKDDCFEKKLKTATQIKKLVPKEKLEIFDDLVHRPLKGYKLVSASAKGEALKTIAEDTITL